MTPQDFLSNLEGAWMLTGEMQGGIPLEQAVSAQRSLGGHFVEMRCVATEGRPYEAIYLLGYDAKAEVLVFHLFDSFGVSDKYRFGTGKLDSNFVRFTFAYETGTFYNTFSWDAGKQEWTMTLTYEQEGEEKVFAVKRLARAGGS